MALTSQSKQPLNRYTIMSKRNKKGAKPNKAQESAKNTDLKKKAKPSAKSTKKQGDSTLLSRRNLIRLLVAVPVVGVAGAAIHRHDVQTRNMHDLSQLGKGTPTIVQIHDPSCPLCRRLMKNTRTALEDRDNVSFRVADVTTGEGKQFQQKYNVPNVTLLLFNGKGKLVDTVQGVTPVEELVTRFAKL